MSTQNVGHCLLYGLTVSSPVYSCYSVLLRGCVTKDQPGHSKPIDTSCLIGTVNHTHRCDLDYVHGRCFFALLQVLQYVWLIWLSKHIVWGWGKIMVLDKLSQSCHFSLLSFAFSGLCVSFHSCTASPLLAQPCSWCSSLPRQLCLCSLVSPCSFPSPLSLRPTPPKPHPLVRLVCIKVQSSVVSFSSPVPVINVEQTLCSWSAGLPSPEFGSTFFSQRDTKVYSVTTSSL